MTEHNIFQEIEEDLQRQKLERLWQRYAPLVLVLAVAIVAATGGITAWRNWKLEHDQKATTGLVELMRDTDKDPTKEIAALQDFVRKNPDTAQAVFAQLNAAAAAAGIGDQDKALKLYDSVAHDAKADPAFRQFADLMAVQIQFDSADPAQLQARLQPLLAENAPWRPTALEYSGYLAVRMGDKSRAKDIFMELSQSAAVPPTLAARAADMLRYVSE